MIKVLLVDDSPTSRFMLSELINSTTDMRVVGEADNHIQVLPLIDELEPNIVLMDLFMPGANGIETTQEIMTKRPTPIVIISGGLSDPDIDKSATIQALRHGALAVVKKPENLMQVSVSHEAKKIINTIRSMSTVKVIHHNRIPSRKKIQQKGSKLEYQAQPQIVSIAVSTGGPNTLATIIPELSSDFSIPIVIVQHITERFLTPLVKWLDSISPLKVTIAEPNQTPQGGHIYFAPIGKHLVVTTSKRFRLVEKPQLLHTPSANVLFESIATVYGENAIGVQLTGMGDDGSIGLKAMLEQGAYTIAQDEATSVVYGMPRAAVEIDAVRHVSALNDIPSLLNLIVQN